MSYFHIFSLPEETTVLKLLTQVTVAGVGKFLYKIDMTKLINMI